MKTGYISSPCLINIQGAIAENPEWIIQVYYTTQEFWDNPVISPLTARLIASGPLEELAAKAKEIEQSAYKEVA